MTENSPSRSGEPDDDRRPRAMVGVPRLSRAHLSRPRLLRALDADGDVPLRVLQAPAGYGKTSLLAEWARTRPAGAPRTLWVTVNGERATRLGFWAHVVGLLHAAGMSRDTGFERFEVTADVVTPLSAVLLHGFESLPQPLTVVVDALENVADDAVEADLLRLVQHTTNLYLAVGTRRPTVLGATSTTLTVDAVVLEARALAFSRAEAAQLAAHVGSPLTAEQVAALHDASDGWPLAVRAGVRTPAEHPWPRAGENDTVSRVQRMLVDDLVGLPGFDDLVLLSVVGDCTAEQAALLGVDLAATPILAEVESRGLGSWEDATGRPRFRIQPLVCEALRARLSEQRLRWAHQRLAAWYEEHGEHARAFESAVVARDWTRARRQVVTSFHQVTSGLDRGWMRRMELSREVLRAQPLLALIAGIGYYARGDVGKAIRTLAGGVATAERQRLAERGQVSVDHLWVQGMLTLGFRFSGRDELVQPALRRLYTMLRRATGPQEELQVFRALLATQGATTYLLLDRVDDASTALLDRPPARRVTGSHDLHAESIAVLAHASAGRITEAREALAEFVDATLPRHFNAGFHAVPKHIGAAHIHLEDRRPDAAEEELAQADPHWPTVEWWPLVLHARALQRWHAAGPGAGLRAIETGLAEKRRKPLGAAMRAMLTALHVELLLATGRPAEARRLLPARRIRPYPRLTVAKARSLLLDGDAARALALATGPEHEHRTTPRDRLNLRLIAASARLRSGDPARAEEDFAAAVDLAVRTGLRSPFAAIPRPDFAALADAVAGGAALRKEIDRFPVLFPEPEEVIPLTRRELVVLAELATPSTLPAIAERLSVASGTVKSQCRAIYRKLGVSGRHEAVSEARRRGIL